LLRPVSFAFHFLLALHILSCATGCGSVSADGNAASDASKAQQIESECGGVSKQGCCQSGMLVWCEDGRLREVSCDDKLFCGWNSDMHGYDCGTNGGSDPGDAWPKQCYELPEDGGNDGSTLPKHVASSDASKVIYDETFLSHVIANELLVRFGENTSSAAMREAAGAIGGKVVGALPAIRVAQVRFPNPNSSADALHAALAVLATEDQIEMVYPNLVMSVLNYPDDGYCWKGQTDDCSCLEGWEPWDIANQVWGLKVIDAPGAWELTHGSDTQPVAVVDLGVWTGHSDFSGRATTASGGSSDSHATHVAGILGATGDNGIGIAGVNWLSPIRSYEVSGAFDPATTSPNFDGCVGLTSVAIAEDALLSAIADNEKGVRVINYSIGYAWTRNMETCFAGGQVVSELPKPIRPHDEATDEGYPDANWVENQKDIWRPVLQAAENAGVLIVAAAGNDSGPALDSQSEGYVWVDAKWTGGVQALATEFHDNVLVVASVGRPKEGSGEFYGDWADQWSQLSFFSNSGPLVDVAAPGAGILSLMIDAKSLWDWIPWNTGCPEPDAGTMGYMSGTSMAAPFVSGIASLAWSLEPDATPAQIKRAVVLGAAAGDVAVSHLDGDGPGSSPDGFFVANATTSTMYIQYLLPCAELGGISEELCNGLDDNCDWQVDEGSICEEYCVAKGPGEPCGLGGICYKEDCCPLESNCIGRQCGSDECGGTCGICEAGSECVAGQCCTPNCGEKECGSDGCLGNCGTCDTSHICSSGSCKYVAQCNNDTCDSDSGEDCESCPADCPCPYGQECDDGICCTPYCGGKVCGDNGCGGTCGSCSAGKKCKSGTCVCAPNCQGKECGSDGCGGSCGSCPSGVDCKGGQCESCYSSCASNLGNCSNIAAYKCVGNCVYWCKCWNGDCGYVSWQLNKNCSSYGCDCGCEMWGGMGFCFVGDSKYPCQ